MIFPLITTAFVILMALKAPKITAVIKNITSLGNLVTHQAPCSVVSHVFLFCFCSLSVLTAFLFLKRKDEWMDRHHV